MFLSWRNKFALISEYYQNAIFPIFTGFNCEFLNLTAPKNTAAFLGDTTVLLCATQAANGISLDWWEYVTSNFGLGKQLTDGDILLDHDWVQQDLVKVSF